MRLQLYIFRLLLKNFLFMLIVVTGVVFLVAMGQTIGRHHDIAMSQLIERFPFMLPAAMQVSVPLSLLAATLLSYGRLSADNEILAIRMAGIHIYRAIAPAFAFALLLTVITLITNAEVAPRASLRARQVTKDDLRKFLDTLAAQRSNSFRNRQLEMHWREVDEQGWLQGLFFELHPDDMERIAGEAEAARITRDDAAGELTFYLKDVTITRGDLEGRITAPLKVLSYDISSLFGKQTKTRKETFTNREITFLTMRNPLLGMSPENRSLTRFRVEYWNRITLSLACLVFVMVGAPVGILFKRGSFVGSSVVALVVAFVIYYPLLQLSKNLSYQHALPAAVAMFIPVGVIGVFGTVLLVKLIRR